MGWATLRSRLNSWHSEKISYHMNSRTTLFSKTGTEAKKLHGRNGVWNRRCLCKEKPKNSRQGTRVPQETSATSQIWRVFAEFCRNRAKMAQKWHKQLIFIRIERMTQIIWLATRWKAVEQQRTTKQKFWHVRQVAGPNVAIKGQFWPKTRHFLRKKVQKWGGPLADGRTETSRRLAIPPPRREFSSRGTARDSPPHSNKLITTLLLTSP